MSKATIILLISCLFAGSCTEYSRVLKSGNTEEKYAVALKMYHKKDYERALPLLEELLVTYRGTDKAEEIYYYYAYCHYGMGNFELAAYHFKNYTQTFFNSVHQEECAYLFAHCIYRDALPYYLDPTSTIRGIAELQLFLNQYPKSIYKETCNKEIETLRKSLHKKAYNNAYLYYKISAFKAAAVSFKNILKDYPDVDDKDLIDFMIVKSTFMLAKNSVETKKEERYNQVFLEYEEFKETNAPSSRYYSEATEIFEKAKKNLQKHKQQKIN
ncbi:MAG: outer membrane protein assembly factor BamD [Bacteroidia bacterium]|nr:outer membrane protein assembly factor BamD [Bacteroidia bacterium]